MSRSSDSLEPRVDAATAAYPPRFRWLKRIGLSLAIAIGVVAGLWGWTLHRANADIAAQIQEIRDRHEPVNVEDLVRTPVPDSQNAVLLLRQAAMLLEAYTGQEQADSQTAFNAVTPSDQARAADRSVRSNAAALALLRKARALPDADWHVHLVTPFLFTILPDLNLPRGLSELMSQAADLSCRQGDFEEVVEDARDMLGMQRAVYRLPGSIAYLVASAIGAGVPELLQQAGAGLVPTHEGLGVHPVSADQLRALLNELLDDRADSAAFVEMIEVERVSFLSSMRFLDLNRPAPAAASFRERDFYPLMLRLYKPIEKRYDADSLRELTQWLKAARTGDNLQSQQQLFLQPSRVPPNLPEIVRDRMGIKPEIGRLFSARAQQLASRRMAAASLAMRLYQADHANRMPAGLADLVPTYLPRIPLDPFDPAGGPIRYATNRRARFYCSSGTQSGTYFLEAAPADSQPTASPAEHQKDKPN